MQNTLDPMRTCTLGPAGDTLRTLAPPVSSASAPAATRSGLPERYVDLGPLGSGGMSELRRVRDEVLGVQLAMKILAWRFVNDAPTRALFLAEARATAQLQHPGIVAVQDFGELPDTRPWFTMTIVQGHTLDALCERPEGTRRRRIAILRQIADVVAYAHTLGVVHRDLKPSNVMIGPFGEVRVMDWGLATMPGIDHPLARDGLIVGTPAYMAPEQAAGHLATPAADVWALGGMLFRLLVDGLPVRGTAMQMLIRRRDGPPPRLPADVDLPTSLRDLCHACLERDPQARPSASAFADALGTWLDGLQRRQEALALVDEVRAERPRIRALRDQAVILRSRAKDLLTDLPPDHEVADKAPAWELQDRASSLDSEAELREVTWHQKLRAALVRSPDLPEAHALLAEHYRDALQDAEHARDPLAIARNEQLLRTHDDGTHAAYLTGRGALTLHTTRPAHARLFRFVERKRRLVPAFERDLGLTPLIEVPVDKGSWLVTLEREGAPTVRYPVLIERAQHWDGVPPEGGDPEPIWMPEAGELGQEDCYVPAGWCVIGADPEAVDPLPRQRVWVDGFVMKRFPVTFAEYLVWLQGLVDAGDEDAVEAAWPQRRSHDQYVVLKAGRVGLVEPDLARCPLVSITHDGATAFAESQGWRLPNELWVEKAGRGADGRLTPWGDTTEALWSRVIGSLPGPATLVPVDRFTTDISAYQIHGLAGNARTWCSNWWSKTGPISEQRVVEPREGTHRAVRGAAFSGRAGLQRLATRFGDRPERRFDSTGLRLCRRLR